ncbi:PilZ domain-containing protein [Qipengyuania atrilutea]|uniref:PilZ domain-containing protein n=1 Tax=Qipengyuania atrilutea TaxID=2744473 RepID=A0A850H548_9SPHN|nr:PilZ domain-containing protein [Actirhodobacter atriluteus]NVD45302.1 PilZ domain-containing protein [Actirhodobacter atriluteus]
MTGLLQLDDEWRAFRIKDISTTGLKGNGILDLPVGMDVQVRIRDSEPIAASIVWSNGSLFGLSFAHPIIPEEFRTRITGSYNPPSGSKKPAPPRRPV